MPDKLIINNKYRPCIIHKMIQGQSSSDRPGVWWPAPGSALVHSGSAATPRSAKLSNTSKALLDSPPTIKLLRPPSFIFITPIAHLTATVSQSTSQNEKTRKQNARARVPTTQVCDRQTVLQLPKCSNRPAS